MKNVLAEKAMLARLNITSWTARRLDKQVTQEVNDSHGAAGDAGRYNKLLISKEALADIVRLDNEARTYFYTKTLPWHDEGARLLPAAISSEVIARLRQFRLDRESAVDNFAANYDVFKQDAKRRLNGLFKDSDYPPCNEISKRFRFNVGIDPVPDSGDFRVALASEQAEDIRAEIEARATAAIETAQRDCFERVAEYVGRMVDRLRSFKPGENGQRAQGIFRDSLVSNLQELADLLPGLNVTGDARIDSLADLIRGKLCVETPETLRENPAVRESVANEAAAILEHVNAFLA